MFDVLRLRIFVAKVQAEIKAQHNDQGFVNFVCQQPDVIEELNRIRKNEYYRSLKIAPFLAACKVLAMNAYAQDSPLEIKMLSATLLQSRLRKARANPEFYEIHQMAFDEIEDLYHAAIEDNRTR